jgi:arylsulfatase A-like enzyme
MCDRWFGYFMERLRALNLLDNTMVILTSDHGHSIGDGGYLGKRGYPSAPEVYDIPMLVRFPGAEYAGQRCANLVQHHDIYTGILEIAGVAPPEKIDGIPFLMDAASGKRGGRDHATVGWGSAPTVITDRWWFNCKMDGTGVLLYDLNKREPFTKNVAADNIDIANRLYALALKDAGGSFPEWLLEMAKNEADAPGCSPIAARV